MHAWENQWAASDTQLETILSSTDFGPPQDLETDSNSFSISGAHLMKARFQKLYLWFWKNKNWPTQNKIWYSSWNAYRETKKKKIITLINSMKLIRRPHGWGRLTIRRSNNTLVICSWIISCPGKRKSAIKLSSRIIHVIIITILDHHILKPVEG